MNEQELTGFILVDKPNGMTSSDCVQVIRSILGKKTKVGHSGTLDAFATGLLIIGIGRAATRELSSIMVLDKKYTATAKLGQLTDTLDLTGRLLEEAEIHITQEQLEQSILSFGSQYVQVPPVYSALKYQGKALSRIARREVLSPESLEKIAQEKSRVVQLYSCKLIDFVSPFFTVQAHVSHGTYIRSLMNDIARNVGSFATTHQLRRTAIGPFSVEQSIRLLELDCITKVEQRLISASIMYSMITSYKL